MRTSDEHQSVDFWLLTIVLILAGIGLVMVQSSSMYEVKGNPSYYFKKQAVRLLIGLFVMMLATKINYRGYAQLATILLVTGYGMLIALLIQNYYFESSVNRALSIGKIEFQPSELMKVILIIFMSSYIAEIGGKVRDFKKGFLPLFGFTILTFVLVVLEPDLGGAGLILVIGLYMLFVGHARLSYLIMVIGPALGCIALIVNLVPYMRDRWMLFINPDTNYQIKQSIISIGSGGLSGVGLGESTQKFGFLPEHHTDFVFSILAEELGFIGISIILLLILIYIFRGFKIAGEAPDMFGFLLASGLSVMIGFQVFINIGVATGLLPTTGMTLPFISYGGSSLLVSFAATGILLNISKQGNYERRLSKQFGKRLDKRRFLY